MIENPLFKTPARTGEADPYGLFTYLVVLDPGPFPLARSTELGLWEVVYGLRYHSFNPGTVLLDLKDNRMHTIRFCDSKLLLDPPCPRLVEILAKITKSRDRRSRD